MDQSMKVLFCVRHNFYSSPGGAQIQILKTVEGLEKLGVAIPPFLWISCCPYCTTFGAKWKPDF